MVARIGAKPRQVQALGDIPRLTTKDSDLMVCFIDSDGSLLRLSKRGIAARKWVVGLSCWVEFESRLGL